MANVDKLISLLDSDDRTARIHALVELEDFGTKARSAVPAVARVLQGDDWELRGAATSTLGGIGGPEAITALKTASVDSEPRVRAAAAVALYRLQEAELADSIFELLRNSPNAYEREVAEAYADFIGGDEE